MRLSRILLASLLIMLMSVVGMAMGQESTPEPTPLTFVTPEGVDFSQVVATIGDKTITLGEYATRLRYEYVRYYRAFEGLVAQEGPIVFDLQSPQNQYAMAIVNVVNLLADKNQFPQEIYRTMILEELYRQEATARNIQLTQCDIDTIWAGILQIELSAECVFPDDFATQKAEYIAFAGRMSGISEATLEDIAVGRAAYRKVQEAIGNEYIPQDQPAVRTRHIRVRDAELAQTVRQRLDNGEDFMTVLAETTVDNNAAGNRGSLGFYPKGQFVPEFDNAIFSNPVGLIQQPVQTQFGYHVIRVDEIGEMTQQVQMRVILLGSEEDANAAIRFINDGADFADLANRFSLDATSKRNGGLLSPLDRPTVVSQFGDAVAEAAFATPDGQVVGPFQTTRGWVVLKVESKLEFPSQVRSSHILVNTQAEAEAIIERINNGEDFGTLAYELSIDPSARGYDGDTLAIVTEGRLKGLYITEDAVREEIDQQVFADGVAVGDIIGPIETRIGFYILQVEEIGTRAYTDAQIEERRTAYIADWEKAQRDGGRVVETTIWRQHAPIEPLPSDVYPDLVQLNLLLSQARDNIQRNLDNTNIINTLRTLRVNSGE
jgi:parvulin-like peptidyl-prolyl isomerase